MEHLLVLLLAFIIIYMLISQLDQCGCSSIFENFERSDYHPETYLRDNTQDNIIDCIKFCEQKSDCVGIVYDIGDRDIKCSTTNKQRTLDYFLDKRKLIEKAEHVPAYDVYQKLGNGTYSVNNSNTVSFSSQIGAITPTQTGYYYVTDDNRPYEPTLCYPNSEMWTFNKCKDECNKLTECQAIAKHRGYHGKSGCCMTDRRTLDKLDETGYFDTYVKT